MAKPKLIEINMDAAKKIVREFDRLESKLCIGCEGNFHAEACPVKASAQLRNHLTQRINNPKRKYGI